MAGVIERPKGLTEVTTHYCPGCTHGIIHRLVAEVLEGMDVLGPVSYTHLDANTGDMMGELNKRRGRVLGMNPEEDNMTMIEAEVPEAEMQDFAMLLRQMTQGAGSFSMEFARYEQLPEQLHVEVISKAKAVMEEA